MQAVIKIIPIDAIGVLPVENVPSSELAQSRSFSGDVAGRREAEITTLLNHPYITNMKDFTRSTYHWYLLSEYVRGGQMLDYIISHGRLKEKGARKFARQIGSALSYCHRQNIVHRNIKIENILISKTGDIKLVDFCCSSLYSRNERSIVQCGSTYFAAPEVIAGKPCIGPEVDVWSFGIVLYVMAVGKVAFDAPEMDDLRSKITKVTEEYPPWLSSGAF
jgi:serine/threonine protein kinase KIN1/2